jgi:hypothetical protein
MKKQRSVVSLFALCVGAVAACGTQSVDPIGGPQPTTFPPTGSPGTGDDTGVPGDDVIGDDSVDGGVVSTNVGALGPTVSAATPPAALAGGTLAALGDGHLVAASDPDRDRLFLTDLTSGVVSSAAFSAGDEPGRVIDDGAGHALVVLRRAGQVAQVDVASATVLQRWNVCPVPRGIAWDGKAGHAWVACMGGELVSLDTSKAGSAGVRLVRSDLDDARDVLVTTTGLTVSRFRDAGVWRLTAADLAASSPTPNPSFVGAVSFTGFVGEIDTHFAFRAASNSSNTFLLHQSERPSTEAVAVQPGGYAGDGCKDPVVSTQITRVASDGTSSMFTTLPQMVLALDFAVSETRIAVIAAGNRSALSNGPQLMILDANTPSFCDTAGLQTLAIPGQVVAVSFPSTGRMVVQTREPAALVVYDTTGATAVVLETITLASDSHRDTGFDVFHTNAGGGIACASCHAEGGEDGHTWNFSGIGQRRTQSLRGGKYLTAPFHWDGDETTDTQLYNDVWTVRMGGLPLDAGQMQAATQWIKSLPLLPKRAGGDPATIAAGQALFNRTDVGCASCHGGEALSTHALVDVGSGGMLKVPSLLNVGYRAPFMHSGCAATLADRFGAATSCTGGDSHGKISGLSAADQLSLVAYMQSL